MSFRYNHNMNQFHPNHLDELVAHLTYPTSVRPQYFRNWRVAADKDHHGSILKKDNQEFRVNLDVQHFKSDEVIIKIKGRTIIVEGKHPERLDEHGFISRQFTRKYILPENYDINEVKSSLSSDGILSITAPKLVLDENKDVKKITIVQTGVPHKQKTDKEENK